MSSEFAISAQGLSKCYHVFRKPSDRLLQMVVRGRKRYYQEFWALRDVSIQVGRGETIGIVGRNGSGKSTLLQLICGTLTPTSGTVETRGRIAALLELGSGFNEEFTGRENIFINAALLGLSRQDLESRLDSILAFADIGAYVDQPIKSYSSGMVVRLAFSVAISVDPQLLIVDEALAVGDAAFQRKCMRRIAELSEAGVTLLFVSHDTETVRKICNKAVYLKEGRIHCYDDAKTVCTEYERDLFGAGTTIRPEVVTSEISIERARLDPDLLPTNEQVYGDGRATIRNVLVTDDAGRQANVLLPGQAFKVTYTTKFKSDAVRPVFGVMITNREGVCIFGANTSETHPSLRTYESGEAVTMTFRMINNLGPGIYYVTCGVHSGGGEGIVYLERRMDTLLIKSLGREGETVGGSAQLYAEISSTWHEGSA